MTYLYLQRYFKSSKKERGQLTIAAIIFFIAVLGVIGFSSFREAQQNRDQINSIHKPENETVAPIITTGHLQSPPMSLYFENDTPKTLAFNINGYWRFKDYEFVRCSDGSACSYYLTLENVINAQYSIDFLTMDTSFNVCDFDNSIDDENVFQHDIPKYEVVKTEFGTIRIGQETSSQNYVVCQNNVGKVAEKNSGWVGVTEIGFIIINTPDKAEKSYLDEIQQILANIEVD